MDNEKILLRFGRSTILMNGEGIWLDAPHIGLQETEIELAQNSILYQDPSIGLQYIDIYGKSPKNELISLTSSKTGKSYQGQSDNTGKLSLEEIDLHYFVANQVTRGDK